MKKINKRILVLGASGFIGRNCVEYFLKKNYIVSGVYFKNKPKFSKKIKLYKHDLTKEKGLNKIFKNIDILIQAAATTSGAKDIVSKPFIHVNSNAIINSVVTSVAFEKKIPRIINFSCTVMYKSSKKPLKESQFYPDKILSNYFGAAWMKIYVERLCEFYSRFGVNKFTLIRHSNIYGPYDKFDLKKSHVFGATISKCMNQKNKDIEVWGNGSEQRNFLHIDDLMNFIDLVIKKQKKNYGLYNLGNNKSISIKNLVIKIRNLSKNKIPITFNLKKPTLKININIDSSKAKKEFGWKQKISLEKGIKKTINWYKENYL
ncbi:NAD-dependent epimerase/dehydratase family protein [Pelagibacterales bacterium SAG-MED33]|nr:NAD-dependent epimerase/dehydratase family protein [Pelagibacterales bacterium SAG-MED33]